MKSYDEQNLEERYIGRLCRCLLPHVDELIIKPIIPHHVDNLRDDKLRFTVSTGDYRNRLSFETSLSKIRLSGYPYMEAEHDAENIINGLSIRGDDNE